MNDFEEKSKNIRSLAALPPDQFVDHLTALHPHISQVAPNIAPHVFSGATNAVQFLNSKLPNMGNELPQDEGMQPAHAQRKAWLDLHDVVNDPVSVLNHVNQGTLNSHHLEALQKVYPDLHSEMREKMLEEVGALQVKGEKLPYQKRLSISKFVGLPLDSTMTVPSMQAILNSATANTGPQSQAQQHKASGAELTTISKVNNLYKTPLQQRQSPPKDE